MVFNEQEGDAGLCFYCSTLGKSHSPSRKSVMVQLAPHWQLNLNPCNEGGLATFLASIVLRNRLRRAVLNRIFWRQNITIFKRLMLQTVVPPIRLEF